MGDLTQPCPLCSTPTDPRLLFGPDSPIAAVTQLIQRSHPQWTPAHGLCPGCALDSVREHARSRSPHSLHDTVQPPTTFPFYHPAEEEVLALSQRLPVHTGLTGRNTVIGFLDSGFYPHPDLTEQPQPFPGLDQLQQWSLEQWRGRIQATTPRIAHYVDQFDGGEREGLGLSSLWDDAGSSWHGMMTTSLAAGNGGLSRGLFASPAPQARILPIKIGQRNGRIPETDILRGFQWLLRDDNWHRYGVRVLNVSVGGDDPMAWQENPVCLAAEELSRRGVLVVVAAGNSQRPILLPPASAPSTLTVGGTDDGNRRHRRYVGHEIGQIDLYRHNWQEIEGPDGPQIKPELLAPAQWLPSPFLPVSPLYGEATGLAQLACALEEGQPAQAMAVAERWQEILKMDPGLMAAPDHAWREIRRRRAAHKWIHAHYQHVDGTSTSAPIVAAVAAQMVQANPHLPPAALKAILLATALRLPHQPEERRGVGLIQPSLAVAAALRAANGPLAAYPLSGASISEYELHNYPVHTPVPGVALQPVYFGLYAPDAWRVSLIGSFNDWLPDVLPLQVTGPGWWHGVVWLPSGFHPYRFWVTDGASPEGAWRPDPENPNRCESGFRQDHGVAVVVQVN